MRSDRRAFLKQTGWLTISALGLPHLALASGSEVVPGARPRHIIHLVSDGMSSATLALADQFSRLLRQRGLRWFELARRPGAASAWVNMRSLNSLVTDSAAASSSWGSGSRVVNGVLNQLPDGRDLRPLYALLQETGWKRGLVTTTEITHATPAGFAANASSRDTAEVIATQYLDRRIDVLLGGGRKFFNHAKRKDQRDLRAEAAQRGYAVMNKAAELAVAPLEKTWLGLFADGHLPYTIDQLASQELLTAVPTLAQMTRAALRKLEREDHFILQVEGGRVDHAAHNCDIAAALREQIALDEALDVCVEFQSRVPETLILATTDHGTGNPSLNGVGAQYNESPVLFAHVLRVQASCSGILRRLEKNPTVAAIQKTLLETTGYKAPEAKAALFAEFLTKKGRTVYDLMNSAGIQLGQLLANHFGVGWVSSAHTAEYVPLVASGPGAERFHGFLQNTDLFHHYLALASIDFRNPEAPLMAESAPAAVAVESGEGYI